RNTPHLLSTPSEKWPASVIAALSQPLFAGAWANVPAPPQVAKLQSILAKQQQQPTGALGGKSTATYQWPPAGSLRSPAGSVLQVAALVQMVLTASDNFTNFDGGDAPASPPAAPLHVFGTAAAGAAAPVGGGDAAETKETLRALFAF